MQITEQVTKLRDLPDFLGFVGEHLKPQFQFYDFGVFLLTDDDELHYDVVGVEGLSDTDWNKAMFETDITFAKHQDSLVAWMMDEIAENEGHKLFDFIDLEQRFPEFYQFKLREFKKEGYRDCLAANLVVGEKVLGMFCINALEKDHFKKERFSLFKNVTDQLSVAISNILANEDILKREREKTLLLQITEQVTKLRPLARFFTLCDRESKTAL